VHDFCEEVPSLLKDAVRGPAAWSRCRSLWRSLRWQMRGSLELQGRHSLGVGVLVWQEEARGPPVWLPWRVLLQCMRRGSSTVLLYHTTP